MSKREINESSLQWKKKLNTIKESSSSDLMKTKIGYEKKVASLRVENVNLTEFLTQIEREVEKTMEWSKGVKREKENTMLFKTGMEHLLTVLTALQQRIGRFTSREEESPVKAEREPLREALQF